MNVGVIGLGLIGTSLARCLLDAGYAVSGYDISAARNSNLTAIGGHACLDAAEVARQCDTVLLAVFNTEQVESLFEGPSHAHLGKRHLVICTSTCDPDRIAALVTRAAARGIRFLECPLSGNSDQIAKGNGIALAGGTRADFEAAQPVLRALCKQSHFLGPAGSGGRAKLAVNLVGGLNRAVLGEGLAFAEAMGLDIRAFLEVLKSSAAYNRAMDTRGMKMVTQDFTPHAWLKQSLKDFSLMHEVASRVGQALPLATVYTELIESCIAHGEGELDNSVVVQELRRRRVKSKSSKP